MSGQNSRSPAIPLYKIVLVGDTGVGKTSIFLRYERNYFSRHRTSSFGVDKCTKEISVDDQLCKLNIWDTAGLERTGSLTSHYYHLAQSIIFVYSVESLASLTALHHWIQDAEQYAPNAKKFLAGNKNDLDKDDWEVYEGILQRFMDNKEFALKFDISALSGDGVCEMFKSISRHLLQRNVKPSLPATDGFSVPDLSQEDSLDLRKSMTSESGSGCSC
ncbi:predicted protein [Nematostella vectensis]|uniref:Uncharacterized protein n=1 Tax=Nematostella vectensis TaxID=45351 RepID=A7SGW2_NEMVE|nr:predicted protein [Nematostella vectensis]|eukprot:XP_001629113.1 predicted protein [Nematostella vectensis]